MSMSELYLVVFFFVNQFLLYIVCFFEFFFISYMIFIYYSIVFPLVERFIHEPLARETG